VALANRFASSERPSILRATSSSIYLSATSSKTKFSGTPKANILPTRLFIIALRRLHARPLVLNLKCVHARRPQFEGQGFCIFDFVLQLFHQGENQMSTIEKSIDVNVPAQIAYNQWTQFEEFPRFMEGVLEVRQLDDKHLRWRTSIGGKEKNFDAEITEQIPDKRIAWRSRSGAPNAGVVTFHPLNDRMSRIMLQMSYEPEGVVEKGGDLLGVASRRIEGDLKRFKEYLEGRGNETGAWRGTVERPG
jgi:uncharacterized membrane protein